MQDMACFGAELAIQGSEGRGCPPVSGPRAAGLATLGVLSSVENPDGLVLFSCWISSEEVVKSEYYYYRRIGKKNLIVRPE